MRGESGGASLEVTLIDRAGVVTTAEVHDVSPSHQHALLKQGEVVDTMDEGIEVSWLGSPCQTEPVIHLSGDESRLNVALDRGPFDGGPCDGIGTAFSILIQTAQPVTEAVIETHE